MQIKLPFKTVKATMAVLFSVLMIITVVSFSIISLTYTNETVLSNSIDYTTRLINQVGREIDSYIEYMENISNVVINNRDTQRYLTVQRDTADSIEERERIQAQFDTVLETRKDISNIAIIGADGRNIVNAGEDVLNPNIDRNQVDWYQGAMLGEKNILTTSHVQYLIDDHYEWVVTLSSGIRKSGSEKADGVFFIDLNYGVLKTLCETDVVGTDYYVFVVDQEGNIIYHPKQRLIYNKLKEEPIDEIVNCQNSYFLTEKGNDQKLYTVSDSLKTGWKIVGVASISALMGNKKETQNLYWVTAFFLISIAIVISTFLSSYISKPIHVLKESMKEVERGHFDNANISVTDESEIGSLSKSFNIMTIKIQHLMKQIIYEEEQKRLNELKILQAQITPHFLYNTLDSIIWMAEGGKNEDVVLMTSSLSKLLRQSINNQNELISLKQELENIDSYLTIQKMRYKDKLEYSIEVEEELYHQEVVKLILQPIVENSIYHGLRYKEGKGNIRIRGYRKEGTMMLEIEDNGIGMNEETCREIMKQTTKEVKESGIGVINVQNRILLYYGKDYGVSYESIPGKGTIATICLPLEERRGTTKRETEV